MTKTMNSRIIEILTLSLALSGCATIEKSTLLGAGTFGAIGTGVGAAAGKNVGGALLGLGIGAILGGAMGFLAHKDMEEKDRLKHPISKDEGADLTPMVTAPQIRRIWVPEKQESGRMEAGHWLWIIEKPSRFTR